MQEKTKLPQDFTFYLTFFKKQKSKQMEEFEENLHNLGTFDNAEDFWSIYEVMKKPSTLDQGCQFFLFKKGVKPFWEHEANVNGGKFSIQIKKDPQANSLWEQLLIEYIAQKPEFQVNGVAINIRHSEIIISIWLKACNNDQQQKIKEWFQQTLQLPNQILITYKDFPKKKEINEMQEKFEKESNQIIIKMGLCNSKNLVKKDMEKDLDKQILQIHVPQYDDYSEKYKMIRPVFLQTPMITTRMAQIIGTKKKVVVKRYKKNRENEFDFFREIYILKTLSHPNIVKVFDYFKTDQSYYIIYEHFDGQPILDYYQDRKEEFTIGIIKKFIYELLTTLKYIHGKGIVHRNIDPRYLLFDGKNFVLVGFGRAALFDQQTLQVNRKQFYRRVQENYYFMSPEMLEEQYTEKTDIWSTGVIFYLILTGKLPFEGNTMEEFLQNLKTQEYDKQEIINLNVSVKLAPLIDSMLNKNATKRATIHQLVENPWFKSIKKNEKELGVQVLSEMKNYKKKSKFINNLKTIYIEKIFSKQEIEQYNTAFKQFDIASDGQISRQEIHKACKLNDILISDSEIEKIFQEYDKDNSDSISFKEFLHAIVETKNLRHQRMYHDLFYYCKEPDQNSIKFQDLKRIFGLSKKHKQVGQIVQKYSKFKELKEPQFIKLMEELLEYYQNEDEKDIQYIESKQTYDS